MSKVDNVIKLIKMLIKSEYYGKVTISFVKGKIQPIVKKDETIEI